MRTSFHPRLINPPFLDPGVFISFLFERRALLFDLGDLHTTAPRDILKVSHAFVTHTHMDHFCGFDTLLRLYLGREKEIHLFGPSGFLRNVEGKLASYTWNLVEDYPHSFRIKATEVDQDTLQSRTYHCRNRFEPEPETIAADFSGVLLEEPQFRIEAVLLDHRMPCLGLSLVENFYVNINKEELKKMGLPTGPWLTQFKKAVYRKKDADSLFEVSWTEGGSPGGSRTYRLGELTERIARISRGQKICYITDVGGSPENRRRIVELVEGADHLFIEAAFLDRDREIASEKNHLTAREAGELAREAGVVQLTPFHFSPRYMDRGEDLEKEAREAFEGK